MTVFEVGEAEGRSQIAMELASALSLDAAIADPGCIPWGEASVLLDRVCQALDYAHGEGTHAALDRRTQFARRNPYALQADIVQFFPSVDHAILRAQLARYIACPQTLRLIDRIIASGAGIHAGAWQMQWFPGDDLLAAARPRGLPIGVRRESVLSDCSMQKCMLNLLFYQQYPTRYRGEATSRVKPAYNVSHSL